MTGIQGERQADGYFTRNSLVPDVQGSAPAVRGHSCSWRTR